MMRNFLLGFFAGAAVLYGSTCFHVVRSQKGTHLVSKTALTYRDTYVDIREFGITEWREHASLAEALAKGGRRDLIEDATQTTIRNALENAWESRNR